MHILDDDSRVSLPKKNIKNSDDQKICAFINDAKESLNISDTREIFTKFIDINDFYSSLAHVCNKGIKIRYITEITKENLSYCKRLQEISKLRHIDKLAFNFAVNEKECFFSISDANGHSFKHFVNSTKEIVSEHQQIFEKLWNIGTDASTRILNLEDNVEESFKIILNTDNAIWLYKSMIESSSNEILLIINDINEFKNLRNLEMVSWLKEAVRKRHVKVKLLLPDIEIGSTGKDIENAYLDLKEFVRDFPLFEFKTIKSSDEVFPKSTILIVDRFSSFVIDLKNTYGSMNDYAMYATYTTNIANVNSYISLYNNLWKQAMLTEQLSLVEHMQRDFINMAAHELRTPTQAILGYSEMAILDDDYKNFDMENGKYLSTIHRNANRLYSLLEDILNVVRIENHSLILNKEPINIFDIITDVIDDFQNLINIENYTNKNIQISLDPLSKELKSVDIIVNVDKIRIYQVLSNLLNNAIKFSDMDGRIMISVEVENDGTAYGNTNNDRDSENFPPIGSEEIKDFDSKSSQVLVKIKDRGKGIPSTISPILFTKFATDSNSGTGLGLYISKNIINAHGGKIWANNNTDGKGATFSFSLPCIRNN